MGFNASLHYQTVEVEHWLLQLFREPGNEMKRVINSQQLAREVIVDDLEQRLNRLAGGYESTVSAQLTTSSKLII